MYNNNSHDIFFFLCEIIDSYLETLSIFMFAPFVRASLQGVCEIRPMWDVKDNHLLFDCLINCGNNETLETRK